MDCNINRKSTTGEKNGKEKNDLHLQPRADIGTVFAAKTEPVDDFASEFPLRGSERRSRPVAPPWNSGARKTNAAVVRGCQGLLTAALTDPTDRAARVQRKLSAAPPSPPLFPTSFHPSARRLFADSDRSPPRTGINGLLSRAALRGGPLLLPCENCLYPAERGLYGG